MSVTINLPAALQPYASGARTLALDSAPRTVRDALGEVGARWPAVLDRVMTEQKEVREHVNLFVGEENVRFLDGLATALRAGDTVTIVAAVSGG